MLLKLLPGVVLLVAFVEGVDGGEDGIDGCLGDGGRAIGGFGICLCVVASV